MPDEKKPAPTTYSSHGRPPPLPTATVEAPPAWMVQIAERLEGRIEDAVRVTTNVGSKVADLHQRFVDVEDRVGDVEKHLGSLRADVDVLKAGRGKRPGGGGYSGEIEAVAVEVREQSNHNANQDAAIAKILTEQAELRGVVDGVAARQVAHAEKVDGLVASQSVQTELLVKVAGTVSSVVDAGRSLWDSPKGKVVKSLLWLAVAGYAARKGIHLGN